MDYTDEEVELITAWNDARKRFIEAKAGRDKDYDEYVEAKAEMSSLRRHWRQIREAVVSEEADGDATAKPTTVKATAKARS